jgi:putative oxidoreductase
MLRIVLGLIFFVHGAQKLLPWFGGPGLKQTMHAMHEHLGLPASLAYLTVGAEFFGGIGLIAGLLSRIAAFGIIVIMLAAIVMVHGRYGLFLDWFGDRKGHGYEYHLLAIALAAAIVVKGSGAASLDRLLYITIGV